MRVLLDVNVVLDALLNRQPFARDAHEIWRASDQGLFEGCIASFTIPTIFYICRKQSNLESARHAVELCVAAFEVAALYRECVLAAQRMAGSDFEDNLQIACAITDFMQGIVTRNPRDFAASPIRIFTPEEFLEILKG